MYDRITRRLLSHGRRTQIPETERAIYTIDETAEKSWNLVRGDGDRTEELPWNEIHCTVEDRGSQLGTDLRAFIVYESLILRKEIAARPLYPLRPSSHYL